MRERIHEVRRLSRYLATIGACATAGGIQARRNSLMWTISFPRSMRGRSTSIPWRPDPRLCEHAGRLRTAGLRDQQRASSSQLLSAFLAAEAGGSAAQRPHPAEEARHRPRDGGRGPPAGAGDVCGLRCALPRFPAGCYGCLGRKETLNTAALARDWDGSGWDPRKSSGAFRTFNGAAVVFRKESAAHGTRRRSRSIILPGWRAKAGCSSTSRTAARPQRARIFELLRFFEAFLRGWSFTEAPDIVARTAGICPIA